jgi:hypothetical protein
MGMRIVGDHEFTDEEKAYLLACNRIDELEQNARDYPVAEVVEEDDYNNWTNKELKAEIDSRNEGRPDDEKLSVGANKAELVATLVADDEAHPEV